MIETVLFWVLAVAAVITAVLVVIQRNAVASAINLILTLLCLAGIYLTLQAPFIAAVQVLVYAGAIMVLFLFVIMLLNIEKEKEKEKRERNRISPARLIGVFLGVALLAQFGVIFGSIVMDPPGNLPGASGSSANAEAIARLLFTDYLLPFEIASLPLLAAIVGAIIIAKRKL